MILAVIGTTSIRIEPEDIVRELPWPVYKNLEEVISGDLGTKKDQKHLSPAEVAREFAMVSILKYREIKADHRKWKEKPEFAVPDGSIRMLKQAHFVLAFWDGKSRETKDQIERARNSGKWLKIVKRK